MQRAYLRPCAVKRADARLMRTPSSCFLVLFLFFVFPCLSTSFPFPCLCLRFPFPVLFPLPLALRLPFVPFSFSGLDRFSFPLPFSSLFAFGTLLLVPGALLPVPRTHSPTPTPGVTKCCACHQKRTRPARTVQSQPSQFPLQLRTTCNCLSRTVAFY